MYKKSSLELISDTADFVMRLREQDAEFCRRMLLAIESGREICPVGTNTEPYTKNPVPADGWKQA
jgi:hypothetical protein